MIADHTVITAITTIVTHNLSHSQ